MPAWLLSVVLEVYTTALWRLLQTAGKTAGDFDMKKLLKGKVRILRKGLLLLAFAALCTGNIFAQKAVSLDLAPLFTGFVATNNNKEEESSFFALSPVFEAAVGKNYSIGGRLDLIFGSIQKQDNTYFGLSMFGRWYPLDTLNKLFVGAEVGFNTLSFKDIDDALFTGVTFALRTGWKQTIGGLFLEPSLGYMIAKSNLLVPVTPWGWVIGLNLGKAF